MEPSKEGPDWEAIHSASFSERPVDAQEFDWNGIGPAPLGPSEVTDLELEKLGPTVEQRSFANELLEQGTSLDAIRLRLISTGMKSEFAEDLVCELAAKLVEPLIVAKASGRTIASRLSDYGLRQKDIERVIHSGQRKHSIRMRSADAELMSRLPPLSFWGRVFKWFGDRFWP